ncbi:MAG: hypothetical protein DRJ34_02415 [Thermoprotei archaeon]|nr:MAG: hypothetical protein DRJ34_02415 [Thermoprotei archaeon]
MNDGVKDVLLIGLDGAMYYFIDYFVNEGLLPNIESLINEGVFGEALPCPPTDTPTNWTTIATGASTATHGVTSFYIHIPGEHYEVGQKFRSRGQLTRYCKAEYIWTVADRYNISSLILNYPAGWPSHLKKGYVCLHTWHMPESVPRIVADPHEYVIKDLSKKNGESIKYNLILQGGLIKNPSSMKIYVVKNNGYRLGIPRKDGLEMVEEGEWSDWIKVSLNVRYRFSEETKRVKCIFKLKPVKISENELRVFRSEIFTVEGWIDPSGMEEDVVKETYLLDEVGLMKSDKKLDYDMFGEEAVFLIKQRLEAYRTARMVNYFRKRVGWHLCYLHYHIMDEVNHRFLGFLYKKFPFYNEEKADFAWKFFAEAYKIIDEFIGFLINSCTTPETLIIVVSDHACVPGWRTLNIRRVFIRERLLHYKFSAGKYVVDWSKTKAFPWVEPLMVWINLKNRDPQGIVERNEYEDMREQIIDILQDLRDPETGERIMTMVMTREESQNIGLGDERTGDVVYFLRPPYTIWCGSIEDILTYMASDRHMGKDWLVLNQSRVTGIHGYYLPNERVENFSNSSVFIIKGPRIKKGERLKKPIRLTDIAPTISYLMGIPPPRDSEGRILYEILE